MLFEFQVIMRADVPQGEIIDEGKEIEREDEAKGEIDVYEEAERCDTETRIAEDERVDGVSRECSERERVKLETEAPNGEGDDGCFSATSER